MELLKKPSLLKTYAIFGSYRDRHAFLTAVGGTENVQPFNAEVLLDVRETGEAHADGEMHEAEVRRRGTTGVLLDSRHTVGLLRHEHNLHRQSGRRKGVERGPLKCLM